MTNLRIVGFELTTLDGTVYPDEATMVKDAHDMMARQRPDLMFRSTTYVHREVSTRWTRREERRVARELGLDV